MESLRKCKKIRIKFSYDFHFSKAKKEVNPDVYE